MDGNFCVGFLRPPRLRERAVCGTDHLPADRDFGTIELIVGPLRYFFVLFGGDDMSIELSPVGARLSLFRGHCTSSQPRLSGQIAASIAQPTSHDVGRSIRR